MWYTVTISRKPHPKQICFSQEFLFQYKFFIPLEKTLAIFRLSFWRKKTEFIRSHDDSLGTAYHFSRQHFNIDETSLKKKIPFVVKQRLRLFFFTVFCTCSWKPFTFYVFAAKLVTEMVYTLPLAPFSPVVSYYTHVIPLLCVIIISAVHSSSSREF